MRELVTSRAGSLDGLYRLSAAVNRAEKASQIYEAAIEALLTSLQADRAAILLFDSAGVMRFVASEGLSAAYREAVEGHSPWSRDTQDAQPVLIPDAEADPDLKDLLPVLQREGIAGLAFIPLLTRGRLLGKFMVYFDAPHEFAEGEVMLAQTIANHVAFALEQKRLENGLTLYRKIFERSPTAIGVIDLEGRYVEQNSAHQELIGYAGEELRSQSPAIHLGEDGFNRVASALSNSDVFREEMLSTTRDGRKLDLDLTAFTVRDEDGNPLCFVGIKHDLTVRKEAERQIREMNARLESRVAERTAELVRAKEEMESFCYSVSHDLRTPLRGMNAAAMMLIEDYSDKLDDSGIRHLNRLGDACVRMAQLIDDLLQYSRLGRKEPSRSSVDLKASAEKIANDLLSRHPNFQVEIEEVPLVDADPDLLEMVLSNLFDNAFKFSSRVENPQVRFGCRTEPTRVVFFVRDNGAGFDPEHVGKLFRPFERLHAITEFPGTGIGLANAKRIIERHGGEIWAEGQLNQGASVYFSLPVGVS